MTARPLRRALLALLGAVAVAGALLPGAAGPAAAADLTKFNPGYIISDAIFYDSSTMTAAGVQSFLDTKGASCVPNADGTPCLKSYRQDTVTRAPDAKCPGGYTGATGERASDIIAKVAAGCGINPRVILVTLQKEQGLITASGASLTATRYQKAMGYGCPDTAPCDALYYGFFNQVYSAAAQFKNYAMNPQNFNYRAGMNNTIRFHPNVACGSSTVFIQNKATAGLYDYTPYQPNAASLAAGYGTGDSCSSYGNRNFYQYFSDWFGNPTGVPPIGFLDSVTTASTSVTATGWALDPDTTDPITVHIYVDDTSTAFVANTSRPDVDAAYHRGANHGFSATVQTTPGQHNVCAWALNSDIGSGNTLLGCRTVQVPSPPRGAFDTETSDATSITTTGWAMDPDTTAPISVQMSVDAATQTFLADGPRPDVDAAFHNGANHGFTATMPAQPGTHTVCLTALKPPPGENRSLGCRSVTVVNHTPTGFLDSVTTTPTSVTASGWALDPDTKDPITVHMYVDGASAAFTANTSRPDIGAAFGLGDLHGYSATMPAAPGSHTVCTYAINATPGDSKPLGCRTVTVRNQAPIGSLDSVTTTPSSVTVSGWALDPDTTDPVTVHMYVDGSSQAFVANASRPDVDAFYHLGALHGFVATMPAATGTHSVCLYAINATPGTNTTLGCRTVTVKNQDPIGVIDTVTASGTTITATGWALDPDTTDPITVHMYVDSASQALLANSPRPDVDAFYHRGPDHGFTGTATAAVGKHTVCFYAINATPGNNPPLGCRTVTVTG
ncbi:MAG TPA: hypothetical protein VGK35_14580 [Actinotalea sp.]